MVPHLTTALAGPLLDLEKRLLGASTGIEQWLRGKWQDHTPPFYCSVDLRNSGYKLAPVDTNLFPAGFNNLNAAFQPLCVQAAMAAIEKICPDARNLLLIPESHTRNTFYLKNLARLASIMWQAGLNVRVGTLLPEITEPTRIALDDGQSVLLEPLVRSERRLGLADFSPCAILLNNDLSGGVPAVLTDLHEQFVIPPLHAGWGSGRRKTVHFGVYDDVAREFSGLIDIDPWLINPYFDLCADVDFREKRSEDALADKVDGVLNQVRTKYREYGIDEEPFVIVKADAGTYGMGIMSVRDAAEVRELNRKQRNKMAVVKEGLAVNQVIIQEGVHTFEMVDEAVAEPVVYMIDRYVVGGFYRVHAQRGRTDSLNAPGMHFRPLAFDAACSTPDYGSGPDEAPNRFYAYGVVARLALLAASLELERYAPPDTAG